MPVAPVYWPQPLNSVGQRKELMPSCNLYVLYVRLFACLVLSDLLTGTMLASPTTIDIKFNPTSVRSGSSFAAAISAMNFIDQTYFDLRFRMPGSGVDQVALNWQRGTSAIHDLPAGTAPGF